MQDHPGIPEKGLTMILRKAKPSEAEDILIFYKKVIKSLINSEFNPKWNDKYPDLRYIEKSIKKGELYICTDNEKIVSSFILNGEFDNDYSNVEWLTEAEEDEIIIIHTFAISSEYRSQGLSKWIFDKIADMAITSNRKTLRIDIVGGNSGARKVFEKLGFRHVCDVEIEHYAVGLQDFHLYEYPLKKNKIGVKAPIILV